MYDNQVSERSTQSYIYQDATLQRTLMQRVFLWMAIGLSITGLTAYVFFENLWVLNLLENKILFYGLLIAEVALVLWISARIAKMSFMTAFGLFGLYAVLNGMTLSTLLLVYTGESVISTFFVSAGMFGAMAVYGYVTKRDLSGMGSMLTMALVGLILASVVNIFLGNSVLSIVISAVGVLVFVGLTAYDVQSIKQLYADAYEDNEMTKKIGVMGALKLYLDFINIFIYMLRFLGDRR